MAATRGRIDKQHIKSTTPRSLVYTDLANEQIYFPPPTGADYVLQWDDSATDFAWFPTTSLINIYNNDGTITGTRVVSFDNPLSFLYDDTVMQSSLILEDTITLNATDVTVGSSVINLTPSLAAFTVNDIATDVGSGVNVSPDLAKLFAEHNTTGDNVSLEISSQMGIISSTYPTFAGLEYFADYSANFTALSLVTKDYVDTAITGATISEPSNQVVYGTGTGVDSSSTFVYNIATGRVGINNSTTPLSPLHVGNRNNNPSTDSQILVSRTMSAAGIAGHSFSDGSDVANGESYNSFDARLDITANITGVNGHYAAFQSVPNLASGITLAEHYGLYDRVNSSGTITKYNAVRALGPTGTVGDYYGFNLTSVVANNATGFALQSLTGTTTATGLTISGVSSAGGVARGIQVTSVSGASARAIYTQGLNEFNTISGGDQNMLMFSRGSVGTGDNMGMIWEGGSGATKYYSNRFSSEFDAILRGDIVFEANQTGASGLGALVENARLKYTGVFNVSTGFQIANAATSGNYLRGNGTNFVSSGLIPADLTQSSATSGQVLAWNGTIWAPATVASSNIYTADGTLAGNRTLTGGTNSLTFNFNDGAGITGAYVGTANYQGFEIQDAVNDLISSLNISSTDLFITLDNLASGTSTTIQGTADDLYLRRTGSTGNQIFSLTGTGMLITDSDLLQGMKYAASYAAYFATNPRSIPDVGYVQTLIAASPSGTVTSVGLSLPSIFSVSGSPVTTSGTLTGTLATQTANTIFAGPTTGAAATPTFRSLVAADITAGGGVTGTGTATRVAFWSGTSTLSSNASLYWDNTTSRLGVGTPSPTALLHVSASSGSTFYAQSSDSGSSTFILQNTHATFNNSLMYMPVTRAASTAYNFIDARANTVQQFVVRGDGRITATADALLNGITIGKGNNSLAFNTALGVSALNAITIGNYNIAVGSGALQFTTDGESNIAIGAGALATNVSGGNNVAIGRSALNVNVSSNNFALGAYSMTGNTTGGNNVAVGYLSMQNNSTGNNNIAIGQQAMRNGTSPSTNTVVGYFAGVEITSNNNVVMGGFAGASVTSGANNTLIGYVAGGSLTTNGGNIMLGYQAGRFETGAERLYISSVVPADEADGRLKAIIYGIMSSTTANQVLSFNAKVGIQVASPTAILHLKAGTATASTAPLKFTTTSAALLTTPEAGAMEVLTGRVYYTDSTPTRNTLAYLTDISTAVPTGVVGQIPFYGTTTALTSEAGSGSDALTWDSTNNRLGVGTTSPSHRVHISGTGQAFKFNNAAADGFAVSQLTTNSWAWTGLSGGMFFNLENADFILPPGQGSIGVGTAYSTTPSAKLHVVGAGATSSTYAAQFHNSTGTSNSLVVRNDGNVGIGTASPSYRLHIEQAGIANSFVGIRIKDTTAASTGAFIGSLRDSGNTFALPGIWLTNSTPDYTNYVFLSDGSRSIFNAPGVQDINFRTNNSNVAVILNNGNFGIGQTTPTATLHLKAGVAAASGGPLKFTVSGAVLQTTPESGVLEVGAADNRIYYTGVSASRNTIAYLTDITGSITGTSGQVAFFNSGTTITSESSDFTWDSSTNRLGIRTSGATAAIDIRGDSLGTTQTTTDGLALVNFTAAAAGAQQISPAIRWRGFGWKTNSTAASQSVEFRSYVVPVQGAAAPTGNLSFGSAINASWTNDQFIFTTAGQFAIGTTTPAVTSILDLTSTTLGVLLPRMTTTQKNAISSPANGLLLYDNTLNKLSVYESSAWKTLGNGIYSGSGSLSGGTTVTMGANSLLFNGSSGTDMATDVTITPGTNEIGLNVTDSSGVINKTGEVFLTVGYAAIGATEGAIPGGNNSYINFQSVNSTWLWGNHEITMSGSGIFVTDGASTGLVYTADYSSNILANNSSIPDIFTVRENAIENYSTITSTTSPVNLNGVPPDYLINQGSTQATFTFSLPASPVDGEVCKLTFANAVTTLTITAQGGITMLGTAPTTAAIGTQLEYKYYHTITSWIRVK